jgi:CRP-like cAMP-binding protein
LAAQVHEYMRIIPFLSAASARQRVAYVVHELMARGAIRGINDTWVLPYRVSVTTIAVMTGATRETVSRTLSSFFRRGILSRDVGSLGVPGTSPLCPHVT